VLGSDEIDAHRTPNVAARAVLGVAGLEAQAWARVALRRGALWFAAFVIALSGAVLYHSLTVGEGAGLGYGIAAYLGGLAAIRTGQATALNRLAVALHGDDPS
jgi:hypothetical protein